MYVQIVSLFSHACVTFTACVYIVLCVFTECCFFLLAALQDNTDELLELVRRGDHLVSPTKDNCTTSSSVRYTDYMQTTPSSSTKGGAVRETNKTVRLKYQDEAEAYSDFKVNINFTPAPQYSEAANHKLESGL